MLPQKWCLLVLACACALPIANSLFIFTIPATATGITLGAAPLATGLATLGLLGKYENIELVSVDQVSSSILNPISKIINYYYYFTHFFFRFNTKTA